MRFLASLPWMVYGLACLPILAAAQAGALPTTRAAPPTDAIAAGDKLTKADAARTELPSLNQPDALTQRGIEKKDIRRGMVVAKPYSIAPHTRETKQPVVSDPDTPATATNTQTSPPMLGTRHDTVKNSIQNIR